MGIYTEKRLLYQKAREEMRKSMNYQWYLFDLDGTLTDPKEGITKSFRYALEKMGVESPELSELERYIGPPLVKSFQEFFSEEDAKRAVVFYRERFRDIGIFENGVYDGIEEMLKAAKESGKKLALATSKPQHFAQIIMDHYGLSQYIDVLVGSRADGQTKADVIRQVFVEAGLTDETKKCAIMVGDRLHDIEGAKECGIDSLGVRFGYAKEHELEDAGADYIVATTEELREFIATH